MDLTRATRRRRGLAAIVVAGISVAALLVRPNGVAPAAAAAPAPLRALIYVADESEGGRVHAYDATTNTAAPDIGVDDTRFNDDDHNQLGVGDLNGDGSDEIVIADQTEGGQVGVFDPVTHKASPTLNVPDTRFDDHPHNQLGVGDLNGDGSDEIVIADQTEGGRIHVYDPVTHQASPDLGVPDTRFDDHPHNQLGVGDLNGDGSDEIVIADQTEGGRIHVYDPVTHQASPSLGVTDTRFNDDPHNQLGVGDVNGDGRDDVLIADASEGGQVLVYDATTQLPLDGLFIGDTTFEDDSDNQLAVGDVNGDGRDEVLIVNDADDGENGGRVDVHDAFLHGPVGGLGVGDTRFDDDSHNQLAVGQFGSGDLDGDTIPDVVELHGVRDTRGNLLVDLAGSFPISPCRKDVLVEIDYMEDSSPGGHSHRPTPAVLDEAIRTMDNPRAGGVANCPYPGASNASGINLVITNRTSMDVLAEQGTLVLPGGFDTLKSNNFDLAAADAYVHYNVWAHEISEGGAAQPSTIGQAAPSDDNQDFVISLGNHRDQVLETVNFLHEFGHVIGLRHGGDSDTNCKPNYLSIMNYFFSNSGLRDSNPLRGPHFAFSGQNLVPGGLDEKHLDETQGIGGPADLMTSWTNDLGVVDSAAANLPLDYNGQNGAVDTDVPVDVNANCGASPDNEVLHGFDDWAKLSRNLRPVPFKANDAGAREPTIEQAQALLAYWDGKQFPDTATQLEPARPGFYGASTGVAVDERNVYAVHQYRTIAEPSTTDGPGTLVVLDRATMTERAKITVGFGPRSVAVNPVTDRAYVVNSGVGSLSLSVIDTSALEVVAEVELGQAPVDVAVNTRLNRVYLSNQAQDSIQVINGATNTKLPAIPIGSDPQGLVVDEATSTLYVAMSHRGGPGPDVTALGTVIDDGLSHPRVLTPVNLGAAGTQPRDVAVDPIGHRIYVAGLGGGGIAPSVIVLDQASRRQIARIPIPSPLRAITVNPQAGLVFAVGEGGVHVLNTVNLAVERHIPAAIAFAVATEPGPARQLYVGDFHDGQLRRLSYSSGTPN